MLEDLKTNTRAVERFLGELTQDFNTGEVLEIRAIGDRNKIHTERFALHAFDDAIDFIVRKNQYHNIYVVVNPVPQDAPKAAKDVDINRALFVFADADELGAADRARSCDLFPKSMEVVTGVVPHFRNHIYYRLSVPLTDMAVWSELQKQWASYLGTDKSIHNPSRIMRVAGTVSYPSPSKIKRGYQVELTRLIIGGVYVE